MDGADHDTRSTAGLGLSADDPGVRMLGKALSDADPSGVLLVHCGDLPGLRPGATRLVSDVRELASSVHTCIAPGPQAQNLQEMRHAAVWPRAHLGKDFSEQCLARAAAALCVDGELWCAVRKRKGAGPLQRTIEALLGNVEIVRRGHGYRLFHARRGPQIDDDLVAELLARTYTVTDEALGDVELHSAPGVFSRRELDAGTRCLLRHAAARIDSTPHTVIDLGAGIGPLAIWAARRWERARVHAIESNLIAVELLARNAAAAGVGDRVEISASDGVPAEVAGGGADLALVNPPTHADTGALTGLFRSLAEHLRPSATAHVVVARARTVSKALDTVAARLQSFSYAGYTVIEASGFCSPPAADPTSAA